MAFENINVTSLRNAINSCKNSLDKTTIQELSNNISNQNVWQSDSQNNLKNALNKLSNTRYKVLEDKLNEYLKIADYIEEYQILNSSNSALLSKSNNLSKRLYYTESYFVDEVDEDGNTIQREHTRTVKDYSVQRQLNSISTQIKDNKDTMEKLKNNISNSL